LTDATILMLGKLIEDPNYGRDAIHIAVAPVVAAERLSPGQHIGLIGTDHAGRTDNPVGIVDPYLPAAVMKGDRFFLFLYPATITSLRHEWTHPAFVAQAANAFNGGGEYAPLYSREDSEKWMRDFVERNDCGSYEAVVDAVRRFADGTDSYVIVRGHDASGRIPSDFWPHAERILGKPVPRPVDSDDHYFSCSC